MFEFHFSLDCQLSCVFSACWNSRVFIEKLNRNFYQRRFYQSFSRVVRFHFVHLSVIFAFYRLFWNYAFILIQSFQFHVPSFVFSDLFGYTWWLIVYAFHHRFDTVFCTSSSRFFSRIFICNWQFDIMFSAFSNFISHCLIFANKRQYVSLSTLPSVFAKLLLRAIIILLSRQFSFFIFSYFRKLKWFWCGFIIALNYHIFRVVTFDFTLPGGSFFLQFFLAEEFLVYVAAELRYVIECLVEKTQIQYAPALPLPSLPPFNDLGRPASAQDHFEREGERGGSSILFDAYQFRHRLALLWC